MKVEYSFIVSIGLVFVFRFRLILPTCICLLLAVFLLAGLEVGPDLGDHGEGVVHLLLEVCIFILELIVLEDELVELVLGGVVKRLQFVFGFGFFLEALDETDHPLALLWRQVAQQVSLIGRHLNY